MYANKIGQITTKKCERIAFVGEEREAQTKTNDREIVAITVTLHILI